MIYSGRVRPIAQYLPENQPNKVHEHSLHSLRHAGARLVEPLLPGRSSRTCRGRGHDTLQLLGHHSPNHELRLPVDVQ